MLMSPRTLGATSVHSRAGDAAAAAYALGAAGRAAVRWMRRMLSSQPSWQPPAAQEQNPWHAIRSENRSDAQKRILVVDADESTALLVVRLLETSGFEAVAATGSEEALRAARSEHFDLVVCDLVLPGLDGWALFRLLQAFGPIPGIAVSSLAFSRYDLACQEAGFAAHLVKPVDIDVLVETVRRVAFSVPARGH